MRWKLESFRNIQLKHKLKQRGLNIYRRNTRTRFQGIRRQQTGVCSFIHTAIGLSASSGTNGSPCKKSGTTTKYPDEATLSAIFLQEERGKKLHQNSFIVDCDKLKQRAQGVIKYKSTGNYSKINSWAKISAINYVNLPVTYLPKVCENNEELLCSDCNSSILRPSGADRLPHPAPKYYYQMASEDETAHFLDSTHDSAKTAGEKQHRC